jgi:hypothetical protein
MHTCEANMHTCEANMHTCEANMPRRTEQRGFALHIVLYLCSVLVLQSRGGGIKAH